jgi:hypothetical protein
MRNLDLAWALVAAMTACLAAMAYVQYQMHSEQVNLHRSFAACEVRLLARIAQLESRAFSLEETNAHLKADTDAAVAGFDQARQRLDGRDYIPLNLRASKHFTRVGGLAMKLTRADPEGQRYGLAVELAGKKIEKKDNLAFEPLRFYDPVRRRLVEILVRDVNKEGITGHISVPKG